MAYQVISGDIQVGVLYLVAGGQSVTYNRQPTAWGKRSGV